jgi:hypothetical protein
MTALAAVEAGVRGWEAVLDAGRKVGPYKK